MIINEGKNPEGSSTDASGNMIRMFLNLGKLDKMGTNNMLELILSTNIPKSAIGKIDIMEKFSFIEVAEEYKENVLGILNGSYYKKRKISVEVANKKSDKPKSDKSKSDNNRNKKNTRNRKR